MTTNTDLEIGNLLVSVIIPCYNAEPWLSDCLDAIIAQTYRPLEIIVVDDGSTDYSLQIIRHYAKQYPELIRYTTGANHGSSTARNRGFELSYGDYLVFFDADDLLMPETLAGQMEVATQTAGAVVACPWWVLLRSGTGWVKIHPAPYQLEDPIASELRYGNYIPVQALLWPRDVFVAVGGWDEMRSPNDDGELRLRARILGTQFTHSLKGGFAWRRYSSSTLSNSKSKWHLESQIIVYEKIEQLLKETRQIQKYRTDLGRAYFRVATGLIVYDEVLGERALKHAYRLAGFRSIQGTMLQKIMHFAIGLKNKEKLARFIMRTPLSRLLGRVRTYSAISGEAKSHESG